VHVTNRQREVLDLMASGLCDKEIGARLGIATRTVRTHVEHIFEEYACHSRAAAVAAWLRSDRGLSAVPTSEPAEWKRASPHSFPLQADAVEEVGQR
jgi:DNA-binding CsgD family transcriptional regulator